LLKIFARAITPMAEREPGGRRAAAEELTMVDQKLGEVERQISALRQERSTLIARRDALKMFLDQATAEEVDWTSSFEWWVRSLHSRLF
jgi:hypothetical protein